MNLQKSKLRAVETAMTAKREEEAKIKATSRNESSAHSQLTALFPDIDQRYLGKLLANETGSIPEIVTRISNQLLDSEYPKDPATRAPSSSWNPPPSYSSADDISDSTLQVESKSKREPVKLPSPPRAPLNSGGGESMLSKATKGWAGGLMDSIKKAASGSSESVSTDRQRDNTAPITPEFTKNIESHLKRSLASLSTENKDFSARVPTGKLYFLICSRSACDPSSSGRFSMPADSRLRLEIVW
jgi:hypothetical protein